ncbi:MAG: hypothetical protein NTV34_05630 [Proteobacteria bacterium]|nr:hypothetical protein [Pseudomonadota bacterium]
MMRLFKQPIRLRVLKIPLGLQFIAPIFLGAGLIAMVTSMVWFGGKRESLAAYAESNLLRFAIRFASARAQEPSPVAVVSVTDSDFLSVAHAPHQILRDAHIDEYAKILESIAAYKPKLVVVSWLGNAQPMTSEYLRPLTDVIDRLGIADKVILAVHYLAIGSVPDDMVRKYQIAEARDCYYEINAFCTWNPAWTWMPQKIANIFWLNQAPWTLSTNLPHIFQNFILNLPDLRTIPHFNFLDFRPPVMAEIQPNAVVFIGNDVSQDVQFRNNKDLLQKTFVASQALTRSLLTDGVPFHLFWAGLAQMFIEGKTVAVVPEWICICALFLMCSAIVASIHYLRGMALGPFLFCALSLPLINALGVKYARVYMPIVPIVASGLAMFIAATFFSIALNSYRKWRYLAVASQADETSDIKENFISLISHNLNTPVAQLLGLLDILIQGKSAGSKHLESAKANLEYMRLTVRAVLDTSSIIQNQSHKITGTIRRFWEDFLNCESSLLARLGVVIDVTPPIDDDLTGEIWFYRYTFDKELFNPTLLYLCALLHVERGVQNLNVNLTPANPEPADPKGLIVRISWPKEQNLASPNLVNKDFSTDFIVKALSRYLALSQEKGNMSISIDELGATLTLPDLYTTKPTDQIQY